MKRIITPLIVFAISVALAGCQMVDLNTPKSSELTSQYDYYEKSSSEIRSAMGVTPEEADEIFIALVSSGLNDKITKISESDYGYKVTFGLKNLEVALSNGAVEEITDGKDILYPEYKQYNFLFDYKIHTEDVYNGSETEIIGERGYISVIKEKFEDVTPENFKEFVETVVDGSGYNWFNIKFDDGTGIIFIGSMGNLYEYGEIDKEGIVTKIISLDALGLDWLYELPDYELPQERITEDNVIVAIENALNGSLGEGEIITSVVLKDNTLYIFVDLGQEDLIPLDLLAETRTSNITDSILNYQQLDEWWERIIIEFSEVGTVTLDKSMIIVSVNGRYFELPENVFGE